MPKEKKNKKIIVLLLILVLILIGAIVFLLAKPTETAVVVKNDIKQQNVEQTGQARYIINSSVNVEKGTMQNLDFVNANKDRLMKCKIVDENGEKIYQSHYIKSGETLTADLINDKKLKRGSNDVVAELYTYSLDKEKIGQANVKIVLFKQ